MKFSPKKFLKAQIQHMFHQNGRFRNAILHELADEGVYFFKSLKDHNIVFYPQDHIGRMIMKHDGFNRHMVQDLDAFLTAHNRSIKGMTILEVGANIGTQTIYFLIDMNCDRVIAVEPEPENIHLLRINVEINGMSDFVTTIQKGASSRAGYLSFVTDRYNMGGSYVGKVGQYTDDGLRQTTVAVSPIDDLLDEPSAIGLVWIDVEGHEAEVFAGMKRLIEKVRPPIFFEFSPDADPDRNISDILMSTYSNVYHYTNAGFQPIGADGLREIEDKGDFLAL